MTIELTDRVAPTDRIEMADSGELTLDYVFERLEQMSVPEGISKSTATNDYGDKKAVYAEAGVPVYLIADPYTGRCHLSTHPKGGEYLSELTVAFGEPRSDGHGRRAHPHDGRCFPRLTPISAHSAPIRLVVMESTPACSSRAIDRRVSAVQAETSSPAAWSRATSSGETSPNR